MSLIFTGSLLYADEFRFNDLLYANYVFLLEKKKKKIQEAYFLQINMYLILL